MPATEQLNIRVTAALKEKFRARAAQEGMSQAQLLEALLKQRGTLEKTEPDETLPPKPPEPPKPEVPAGPAVEAGVNFVLWLQTRTGVPAALVKRAVRSGRVLVAGVPYTAEVISPETLAMGVTYEGQSLEVRA